MSLPRSIEAGIDQSGFASLMIPPQLEGTRFIFEHEALKGPVLLIFGSEPKPSPQPTSERPESMEDILISIRTLSPPSEITEEVVFETSPGLHAEDEEIDEDRYVRDRSTKLMNVFLAT